MSLEALPFGLEHRQDEGRLLQGQSSGGGIECQLGKGDTTGLGPHTCLSLAVGREKGIACKDL